MAQVSTTSRLRDLRPYLLVALLPVTVALLGMQSRAGVLFGAMWAALVLTIGFAATSRRPEQQRTWSERGRLHG